MLSCVLDHSSVINLSSYSLSTDETSVLARGLTFCPTPRHIDWPEVLLTKLSIYALLNLLHTYSNEATNETLSQNKYNVPPTFHAQSLYKPKTLTNLHVFLLQLILIHHFLTSLTSLKNITIYCSLLTAAKRFFHIYLL